jgi:hypothetical protein
MVKQNVTLALPKELLRKAKRVELDRQLSLSGLLIQLLTDTVKQAEEYELARNRSLERMQKGFDLGTQGLITWRREDIKVYRPV